MNLRNTLQLIGRINELDSHLIGGKQVTTLTLLINDSYINEDNFEVFVINEYNLICKNDKAKTLKDICKKGNEILVYGKLIKNNQAIQIEVNNFIFFN